MVKGAIYKVLATLLNEHTPISKVLDIVTKLYDRLVTLCIDLALKNQPTNPPAIFCFYQMGSAGSAEQFLMTDQDHLLVYKNAESEGYFKGLSQEIVRLLELAGYEHCKGNMMASYSLWRGTLGVWEDRVRTWSVHSSNEKLLLAQNFFSYRFLYGNEQLHKEFESRVKKQLKSSKIFLFRLNEVEKTNQVPELDHPIRALFRLERKQLDVKKEVLFPYHHSLQNLSLLHGIVSGTPLQRLDELVDKKVISESFAKDVKWAVGEVMRVYISHRWKQVMKDEKLTSIIQFSDFTTREKDELILSVKTIKELQSIVFTYF